MDNRLGHSGPDQLAQYSQGVTHPRDIKSTAINALANHCENEASSMVNRDDINRQKILGDISLIKIRESKKRARPRHFDSSDPDSSLPQ